MNRPFVPSHSKVNVLCSIWLSFYVFLLSLQNAQKCSASKKRMGFTESRAHINEIRMET